MTQVGHKLVVLELPNGSHKVLPKDRNLWTEMRTTGAKVAFREDAITDPEEDPDGTAIFDQARETARAMGIAHVTGLDEPKGEGDEPEGSSGCA